ncbi:hypothetical protein OPT61_g1684 [Boeremia exigua]|uniref:Uncharacterized protein n=1 Tax=Boeremia exigua TaxID=749465 RepID=A0ACC2IP83_9PLEO|nr:hypothetical protein OPT61_g1684 [Boeremia exigua]
MKPSTIFTSIAVIAVSSVSAQTACDPVASAVPTCGVRLHSLLASFHCFWPRFEETNKVYRFLASLLLLRPPAAAVATIDAAAPARRSFRPQLKAALLATVA